ncbi:hypothetical protein G6514_007962 [Epicoccum nigrum]|nr:hypothetical protein G6514_007962 [Epicoccum nigrum]
MRSLSRDEALEEDGRAVWQASIGLDLLENVETETTHTQNNNTDSIDMYSLFGSPPLLSPLPPRPLSPLVATAPAQQRQSFNPLRPASEPVKTPVERKPRRKSNATPPKIQNEKLRRLFNNQKPPQERKDPNRMVLKQTPRTEYR